MASDPMAFMHALFMRSTTASEGDPANYMPDDGQDGSATGGEVSPPESEMTNDIDEDAWREQAEAEEAARCQEEDDHGHD
jgi:hypothetical protein